MDGGVEVAEDSTGGGGGGGGPDGNPAAVDMAGGEGITGGGSGRVRQFRGRKKDLEV
jgi:hypothetical protein